MNVWQKQTQWNAAYEGGVAVSVPGFDGWKFYVRHAGAYNVHLIRARVRILNSSPEIVAYIERANAEGYVSTPEDEALDRQIVFDAFCEGCIAKFEGVTDEHGAAIPFSVANARRVLGHFPQLYAFLRAFADDARNFPGIDDVDKKEATIAGNSAPALGTASALGGNTSHSTRRATGGGKTRRAK